MWRSCSSWPITSFLLVGYLDYRQLLRTCRGWQLTFLLAVAVNIFVPRIALLSLGAACYLLPFFVLGYGLKRFAAALARPGVVASYAVLFTAAMAVQQLAYFDYLSSDGSIDGYVQTALIVAVGLSANVLILRHRRAWQPLALIGGFAFTIYLFHPFSVGIGTRLAAALVDVAQHRGVHFDICMVVGIGLPIALQTVLGGYRWFRLPFLGLRPVH